MGYIKEPKGVDFLVAPTVLTTDDIKAITTAIADYRRINSAQAAKDDAIQPSVRQTRRKKLSLSR